MHMAHSPNDRKVVRRSNGTHTRAQHKGCKHIALVTDDSNNERNKIQQ